MDAMSATSARVEGAHRRLTLGEDVRRDKGDQRVDTARQSLGALLPCLAEPVATLGREEVERDEKARSSVNR